MCGRRSGTDKAAEAKAAEEQAKQEAAAAEAKAAEQQRIQEAKAAAVETYKQEQAAAATSVAQENRQTSLESTVSPTTPATTTDLPTPDAPKSSSQMRARRLSLLGSSSLSDSGRAIRSSRSGRRGLLTGLGGGIGYFSRFM